MKSKILIASVATLIVASAGITAIFLNTSENQYSFASSQYGGQAFCSVASELYFSSAQLRDAGVSREASQARNAIQMGEEKYLMVSKALNMPKALDAIYGYLSETSPAEIREQSFAYCIDSEAAEH